MTAPDGGLDIQAGGLRERIPGAADDSCKRGSGPLTLAYAWVRGGFQVRGETLTNLRVIGNAVIDEDEQPTFAAFWLLWPKRVAKFEAERAWKRLSAADQIDALIGLVAWRQVWIRRGEMQYVPYASTWLHQQRWTDELPDQWASTSAHASHVEAKLPESGERSRMPDHVKAALAKLRGK